jgi:hypothetical protein
VRKKAGAQVPASNQQKSKKGSMQCQSSQQSLASSHRAPTTAPALLREHAMQQHAHAVPSGHKPADIDAVPWCAARSRARRAPFRSPGAATAFCCYGSERYRLNTRAAAQDETPAPRHERVRQPSAFWHILGMLNTRAGGRDWFFKALVDDAGFALQLTNLTEVWSQSMPLSGMPAKLGKQFDALGMPCGPEPQRPVPSAYTHLCCFWCAVRTLPRQMPKTCCT